MERVRYREIIRSAFPDAYDYADGAIVLDKDLIIIFFSDGSNEIFGFDPLMAVGATIDLLKCPDLSSEFLQRELDFFVDQFLTKGVFTHRGRPVRAGEALSTKDRRDNPVRVRAGVHPLAIDGVIHLVIFFQQINGKSPQQHEAALHAPNSPFQVNPQPPEHKPDSTIAGQAIAIGNWVTGLSLRGQIVVFAIVLAGVIALLIWRVDALTDLLKQGDSKPKPPSTGVPQSPPPPNVERAPDGSIHIRTGSDR